MSDSSLTPALARRAVRGANAPVSSAPYTPGVQVGNTLYISGQLGLDPQTGSPHAEFAKQVEGAIHGLKTLVEAAGGTAVNVRAGARTRLSAIIHSFVLVLVVLFGGSLVARIPLAALAGVLMLTASRMVEIHNVRAVLLSTRSDASVLAVTAGATIAFDLIVAVELGIALAAILTLLKIAESTSAVREAVTFDGIDDAVEASLLRDRIICYRIDGALFFGAAQRFLTEFTAVTDVNVVILRLPDLQMLDATGAQALSEIVAELEARRITVLIKGPRPEHLKLLGRVGTLDRLAHENHLFTDFDAAVAHARVHAGRAHHN